MFVDFAEKKWENCVRGFMKKWFTEKVLLKYWVENASKYKLKDGRKIRSEIKKMDHSMIVKLMSLCRE